MDETQHNSPVATPSRPSRAPGNTKRLRVLVLLMLILTVAVLALGLLYVHRAGSPHEIRDVRGDALDRRGDIKPTDSPYVLGPQFQVGECVEVDEADLEQMPDGRFRGPVRTAVGGRFEDGATPPPEAPPAGADLMGDSLAAAGLGQIEGDVADAMAPPQAKRLYAFRHKAPDGAADTCAYLIPMSLASAEKFYETRLPKKGYNLVVSRDTRRGTGRLMAFAKDRDRYYYVSLHPTDKDDQVKAVLVIARPASSKGGT